MGLWRNLFGPGQNEVWSGIAKTINAKYTPADWMHKGRIDLHGENFIITLDSYRVRRGKGSSTYTRMRAPFKNSNNMQMNIYREGFFSGMGKMMGMSDLTVGDEFFDKEFIIQGSPEPKIVAFLKDAKLKQLIKAQPSVAFSIRKDEGWFRDHYPDGIDELYFQCGGIVKDEARLKQLFELFVASIDRLSEIDSGCEFGVNITPPQ
jgi:hypothetical protein